MHRTRPCLAAGHSRRALMTRRQTQIPNNRSGRIRDAGEQKSVKRLQRHTCSSAAPESNRGWAAFQAEAARCWNSLQNRPPFKQGDQLMRLGGWGSGETRRPAKRPSAWYGRDSAVIRSIVATSGVTATVPVQSKEQALARSLLLIPEQPIELLDPCFPFRTVGTAFVIIDAARMPVPTGTNTSDRASSIAESRTKAPTIIARRYQLPASSARKAQG
jgi:hypothetical protein